MKDSYKFCNNLFHGCGIAGMQMLDADSIPLVVTSPPFGSIRDYGGHAFYFKAMAKELWRVIAPGGVVCWHVQEQIVDGAESGASSEQRLFFRDLGFRLHQTLVIDAQAFYTPRVRCRYGGSPQYVFVLSKGKPQTFHPIRKQPNRLAGITCIYKDRAETGVVTRRVRKRISPFRTCNEVWQYQVGSRNSSDTHYHPALMPEALARDLILSFSNEGDLVLDPMSGAATTAKMAFLNNRRYLGFEINREYHDLAVERLSEVAEKATMPKEAVRRPNRRKGNDGNNTSMAG